VTCIKQELKHQKEFFL